MARTGQIYLRSVAARGCGHAIALFARLVTAVRAIWQGVDPGEARQRIYYANHASHGDFILIWSALPRALRQHVRPVAGKDYWSGGLHAVITMFGFLGGLVMSAIKRDRGIKDWGHSIAGHGGFIDRVDSTPF